MAKIGVYCICKNEKDFIVRLLDSIQEADFIVVCDTGSTDGTFEMLQGLQQDLKFNGMIVKKICVNPWRFDDARNTALYLMPPDIDVCISIDADEMMDSGWYHSLSQEIDHDLNNTGKPADRYHHRFKTIWDWDKESINISEHWHERIHSRHGYKWKLPVHEVLVKCDRSPEVVKFLSNILMIQKPDTSKNRGSYLPLLEISVKEDPKIWKTFSFLAGEYINVGRYDDAKKSIEHAISIKDSDKAYLSYQLSSMYQKVQDFDFAIIEMNNACKFAPNVREYMVYLAAIYFSMERISDAIITLDRASKITERTFGYEYNPIAWGESFIGLQKFYRSKL